MTTGTFRAPPKGEKKKKKKNRKHSGAPELGKDRKQSDHEEKALKKAKEALRRPETESMRASRKNLFIPSSSSGNVTDLDKAATSPAPPKLLSPDKKSRHISGV